MSSQEWHLHSMVLIRVPVNREDKRVDLIAWLSVWEVFCNEVEARGRHSCLLGQRSYWTVVAFCGAGATSSIRHSPYGHDRIDQSCGFIVRDVDDSERQSPSDYCPRSEVHPDFSAAAGSAFSGILL